jgi:hypothetical protein
MQKRFLHLMRYKLGKIDIPSNALAEELNLQFLADERLNDDKLLLFKLLNSLFELIAKIL